MKTEMRMMLRPVLTAAAVALVLTTMPTQAEDVVESNSGPVRMTVTANVNASKRMPPIGKDDVIVKKGKERLPVIDWVPAEGNLAGLELFILIDDASNSRLGSQLDELRTFIQAQPTSTYVGVGYMSNGTVRLVQDLTAEHAKAAAALRLPLNSVGAYGSPYLSVMDLMKRWPQSSNRREVIMVTDGLDRAGRGNNALLNPDLDSAAQIAQRSDTIIHTIYFPGARHGRLLFWRANNGQNGLAKLSSATGGESYFLDLQAPVSFEPYLAKLQRIFNNQYLLTFAAVPTKTGGLQYVNISTEIAGVDFAAADAVWGSAAK